MTADICMICEGSYPFHSGGVSEWVHQLLHEHKERTFYILTLMPQNEVLKMAYTLPSNVVGSSVWIVQHLPKGSHSLPEKFWPLLEKAIQGLIASKTFDQFEPLLALFHEQEKILGKRNLLESEKAWDFILKLYEEEIPSGPFKAYFATVFTLCRSLYSVMLPRLPKAKLYHAVCTGYAGFLLYRAKKEMGAPCILTEHGIYSNERRIEIAMADWISDLTSLDLNLEIKKRSLKDFWLNTFFSMAHVCYKNCDAALSTFSGNQEIQKEGGADPAKMQVVVHGIPLEAHEKRRKKASKTIAFIGRVVPIKDVKTYIRACQIVKEKHPDVRCLLLGPIQEDPEYVQECKGLIETLHLDMEVAGRVNVREKFPEIDLIVLTSISEAQPLIILEAGAFGIPAVATNIGGCSELLYGSDSEDPPLGKGGLVTPLVNPDATAEAILKLLEDEAFYDSCSATIAKRIETYYRFDQESAFYRNLYQRLAWQE